MKMFKTFRVVGLLAAAVGAEAADNAHYLHVNIPFAFTVADQQFAPGSYNVTESDTGIITIQGEGKAAAVISTPFEMKANETSSLRFTNNNSRAYLVGVSIEGEGSRSVPEHVAPQHASPLSAQ
jgi:hypothetical protein